MAEFLPPFYQDVARRYSVVRERHEAFAAACHEAGPLDPKIRHLVKLGIAIGARHVGAVQSHVRQALEAGATREELEHVALLAASTTGFPNTVAALSWIAEVLQARAAG
ncbi:MAG: carboxymuconolactone decarboxylase family protein [Gemmatimonadetes bacterium]|nr:carboxymuconolactone decarboxylase family protein [Gemmatimonadota bacterium]